MKESIQTIYELQEELEEKEFGELSYQHQVLHGNILKMCYRAKISEEFTKSNWEVYNRFLYAEGYQEEVPKREEYIVQKIHERLPLLREGIFFGIKNPDIETIVSSGPGESLEENALKIFGFEGDAKIEAKKYIEPIIQTFLTAYEYSTLMEEDPSEKVLFNSLDFLGKSPRSVACSINLEKILEGISLFEKNPCNSEENPDGSVKVLRQINSYLSKFNERYGSQIFSQGSFKVDSVEALKILTIFPTILSSRITYEDPSRPNIRKASLPDGFRSIPNSISEEVSLQRRISVDENHLMARTEIIILNALGGKYSPEDSHEGRRLTSIMRNKLNGNSSFRYGEKLENPSLNGELLGRYLADLDIENALHLVQKQKSLQRNLPSLLERRLSEEELDETFYSEEEDTPKLIWKYKQLHRLDEFFHSIPADVINPESGIVSNVNIILENFSEYMQFKFGLNFLDGSPTYRPNFPLKRYLNALSKRLLKSGPIEMAPMRIKNGEIQNSEIFLWDNRTTYPLFKITPRDDRYKIIQDLISETVEIKDKLYFLSLKESINEIGKRWKDTIKKENL